MENIVADHLSRIPNAPVEITPINEDFPDEHILAICHEPWYADIVNYLATEEIPSEWSNQDKYHSSLRFCSSFGKNHISLNTVLIKSLDGVFLKMNI